MSTPMIRRVNPAQMGRADAAAWAAIDPVLTEGELGWTADTGIIKVGDGETSWSGLPAAGQSLLSTRSVKEFASIQEGIDELGALGGGNLVLPAGVYVLDEPINLVDAPGVHLIGAGRGATVLRQTELDVPIVLLSGPYKGLRDMQLRYATPASAGGNAIQLEGLLSYCDSTNLHLWNCYNGVTYGDDVVGEFSNIWANIRISTFKNSALKMSGGGAVSTGSVWNNIYVNNYNGTVAGACGDYPVHFQNHTGVFNQLNVEWCDTTSPARDLMLFQQCRGVTINGLHQEGNKLPTGRGFVSTFNRTCLSINAWQASHTVNASGSIGLLRPGAGGLITVEGLVLAANEGIAGSLYLIFDTSLATDAMVVVDGVDDPDDALAGYELNYAGSSSARAYKGSSWSALGEPSAPETVTDLSTLIAALAAKGIVVDGT